MAGYPAEHQLAYLAETYAAGAVVGTVAGFLRRSQHPSTRVDYWALLGGAAGMWFGLWLILLSPVLS